MSNYKELLILKIYLSIFYVKFMNGTFAYTDELILIRDMGLLIELYIYCLIPCV